MSEFEGKVAVITGGGGGIGKATAARLLDEGASVVLSSRRQEVLEAREDKPLTKLRTTITNQEDTVVLDGSALVWTEPV